jgi:N-acetylmuramoyl-L-alanine amidase
VKITLKVSFRHNYNIMSYFFKGGNNNMKIYLSGSTQNNNVGVGAYGIEADRMQQLADKVAYYINKGNGGFTIYRNNKNMSLQSTVADSNNKLSENDIHIALHTNAGGGKGTECFYYDGSPQSYKLAQCVYNRIAPLTSSADRGLKVGNGLYEVRETIAKACLPEIVFHDNISDVNDYLSKIEEVAQGIALAVYDYAGVKYSPTQPQPDPKTDDTTIYLVQCGAFRNRVNADNLAMQLNKCGFSSIIKIEKSK